MVVIERIPIGDFTVILVVFLFSSDGITEQIEEYGPATVRKEETSYEQLLKQYSRDRRH